MSGMVVNNTPLLILVIQWLILKHDNSIHHNDIHLIQRNPHNTYTPLDQGRHSYNRCQ
jgi:hypothetical protein